MITRATVASTSGFIDVNECARLPARRVNGFSIKTKSSLSLPSVVALEAQPSVVRHLLPSYYSPLRELQPFNWTTLETGRFWRNQSVIQIAWLDQFHHVAANKRSVSARLPDSQANLADTR